jgi:Uma2 family endonuclease
MSAGFVTAADLQLQLGGIPLERIRLVPPPGMATDDDAMAVMDREGRTCEVIDGVLVEKAMGYFESRMAIVIAYFIERFLDGRDLGIVLGSDGLLRISSTRSRAPDVSFLNWSKFPSRQLPAEPVPHLVPDLAVEVISQGNTRAEMEAKLDEYFAAGVQAAWIIDPKRESAVVYEGRDATVAVDIEGTLTAPAVLPGFALSMRELFNRAGNRKS